jgi:hypothetical protein
MGLQNATLKDEATSFSITGGTDVTFNIDGQVVNGGGIHTVDVAATDNRTRRNFVFKSKAHALQPDGKYSKQKRWITFRLPKILDDGSTVLEVYRFESEIHPETSLAEEKAQRYLFLQTLFDTDFESFHSVGSLI